VSNVEKHLKEQLQSDFFARKIISTIIHHLVLIIHHTVFCLLVELLAYFLCRSLSQIIPIKSTMKYLTAVCLFLASAADGSKFSDRAIRNEFVRAMEKVSRQKKQEEGFYKRLLRVAKPVTPEFMLERNLENDDAIEQYGLNLTNYALKYVGCQNIHTYSDELAEDGDSGTVLEMNRFVIIRLCPRDLCSNYNEFGCNSGFGDFVISMEEYLAAMADSYFNQYQEYCETCNYCKKQSQYSYSNNQYAQGDDAAAAYGDDAAAAYGDDAAAADGDDAAAADGDDAAAADAGDDYYNRRELANGDDANGNYYSDDKYNGSALRSVLPVCVI
jgi:hypothetical protein